MQLHVTRQKNFEICSVYRVVGKDVCARVFVLPEHRPEVIAVPEQ